MSVEFSPLRQLAIRLACIHAEDRAWVLAQLADDERETVDALLQEIDDLGLARDPAVLAAILSAPVQPAFAATASILPDDVSLHDLAARAPHPFWAAVLLQGREPGQRAKVMTGLPDAGHARRWDQALADIEVPPALAQALRLKLLDGDAHG